MVATAEIADRAAAELTCRRAVRVVKLYGAGLQTVGTDNAISTGPYEPCGLWSDALWSHSDSPDGIAYQSRHDSNELCIALFQRPDMEFEIKATRPLMTMLNRGSNHDGKMSNGRNGTHSHEQRNWRLWQKCQLPVAKSIRVEA